jgi:hypothetical protein
MMSSFSGIQETEVDSEWGISETIAWFDGVAENGIIETVLKTPDTNPHKNDNDKIYPFADSLDRSQQVTGAFYQAILNSDS